MNKNRINLKITGTGEFADYQVEESTDGAVLAFVKDESSNPNHDSPFHSRDIGFAVLGDVAPRDMLNMVAGIHNALYNNMGPDQARELINLAHELARKGHEYQEKGGQ